MDPSTETRLAVDLWVILGAYIVPSIISIGTFIWQIRKDRATITKIDSDVGHQETQDDIDSGKLSLEWAREFRNRLELVETMNNQACVELEQLRRKNLELEAKIRQLQEDNEELQEQLTNLQNENGRLTSRIVELEVENGALKKNIANLCNGNHKEEPC